MEKNSKKNSKKGQDALISLLIKEINRESMSQKNKKIKYKWKSHNICKKNI